VTAVVLQLPDGPVAISRVVIGLSFQGPRGEVVSRRGDESSQSPGVVNRFFSFCFRLDFFRDFKHLDPVRGVGGVLLFVGTSKFFVVILRRVPVSGSPDALMGARYYNSESGASRRLTRR